MKLHLTMSSVPYVPSEAFFTMAAATDVTANTKANTGLRIALAKCLSGLNPNEQTAIRQI
jgi:hypothetical protein